MTEIQLDDVHKWVARYGATKRQIWIHPELVQYESKTGGIIRPIEDPIYNVDTKSVDAVKRQYFVSKTFYAMRADKKLELLEIIGLSPDLRSELAKRPSFRRLFQEMTI
jgi:hypothetical protein